ncbi:MAG: YccF domain-containing protein [Solobacterium sp.]|nr:YccF domain-containing protein [Solobacterium sp.]
MAAVNLVFSFRWSLAIAGIPFGKQFFKLAKLSLTPFDAEIV